MNDNSLPNNKVKVVLNKDPTNPMQEVFSQQHWDDMIYRLESKLKSKERTGDVCDVN